MNIAVLGCGRWGSFIAWYLNRIGNSVRLWGRKDSENIKQLKETGENAFLKLDDKICITDNLEESVEKSEVIVISISAQQLRAFAKSIKQLNLNLDNKIFILCMKGIEEATGKRLSEVVKDVLGRDLNIAVWVGPGHVQDFVREIPNCMVIDSDNEKVKRYLTENFSSSLIRFYYGTDLIGSEIGAAAKNVIGIAAGVLDGMNYQSLKGALMSRGTREIARLIKAMGGNEISAYGLAHLGDYEATLFSPHSNNRKFGECLITLQPYDKLSEGVATSKALTYLAKKHDVELPICQSVCEVVSGKISPETAIERLFIRSIKREF